MLFFNLHSLSFYANNYLLLSGKLNSPHNITYLVSSKPQYFKALTHPKL